MRPKKAFLIPQSHPNAQIGIDVALAAIDHGDVSPAQWNDLVVQYLGRVRAWIHQV